MTSGELDVGRLARAQGAFFVVTGLWPILHMRSFEAMTGPKLERWLVKTMGGLIAVIGGVLIAQSGERSNSRAISLLGVGSAATLAASDFIYAGKRRISPVYLLDGAVEATLVCAWVSRLRRSPHSAPQRATNSSV